MKFSNLKVGATLRHKENQELISVSRIDTETGLFLGSDGKSHDCLAFKRTPAAKLGYVVGDQFLGNVPLRFNSGTLKSLMILSEDDGSDCPLFKEPRTGGLFYRFLETVKPHTSQEHENEG